MRTGTETTLAEIPLTDLDPAGFGYAGIRSVTDDQGAATDPSKRGQPLGTTVDTSRILYPGDREVFRCWATSLTVGSCDGGRIPKALAGNSRCVATRSSSRGSCSRGPSGIAFYAGVGMAADSRYHRHGGPGEEGYDEWVVFYYRVRPVFPALRSAGCVAHPTQQLLGERSRIVHVSHEVAPDQREVETVTRHDQKGPRLLRR